MTPNFLVFLFRPVMKILLLPFSSALARSALLSHFFPELQLLLVLLPESPKNEIPRKKEAAACQPFMLKVKGAKEATQERTKL